MREADAKMHRFGCATMKLLFFILMSALLSMLASCTPGRSIHVESRLSYPINVSVYWPGEPNMLGHIGIGPGVSVVRVDGASSLRIRNDQIGSKIPATMYGQWKIAVHQYDNPSRFKVWELDYQLARSIDVRIEPHENSFGINAGVDHKNIPVRLLNAGEDHQLE